MHTVMRFRRMRSSALAVVVTALVATGVFAGAKKRASNDVPVPFTRAWRYETPAMTGLPAATDAEIVALPLVDGRVVALDAENGNLLWSADPGGEVSAPPLVTSTAVIVATARTGGEYEGVVRALDRATGLSLWVRELPKPVVSEIAALEDRLFCGASDGSLYSIAADSGKTIWVFSAKAAIRGQIVFHGTEILVGGDDNALHAVNLKTGVEVWRYETGGPVVGRPAVDGHRVFFTSHDGFAYAYDAATQRLLWRSRTGAAIEAGPRLVDDDAILIASFDNFVYLLDLESGDRIWKRRLGGRLVSDPIANGAGRVIVAPLREDRLTVIGVKDGNKIAAFPLDQGDELVAPPTLVDDLLLLPTDTGLLAARSAK